MTKEQAIKIVEKERPGYVIKKTKEFEKCFLVVVEPEDYEESYGPFVGGALRVDKKNGEVDLYNPMIEVFR